MHDGASAHYPSPKVRSFLSLVYREDMLTRGDLLQKIKKYVLKKEFRVIRNKHIFINSKAVLK